MSGLDFLYQYRALVRRVYDGDTVRMDIDLGMRVWIYDEPVRLYGINAPELRGRERPAGILARDYLKTLVDDKMVTARTYQDKRGKYGRWLVQIRLDDGTDINRKMVEAGHAEWASY